MTPPTALHSPVTETAKSPGTATSPASARRRAPGELWAVILAGGEGIRLRPLTRVICGDDRPKQYVAVTGGRSLLRQTLDRTALRVPALRTVVISVESHASHLAAAMPDPSASVLLQPADRGTAAGVLLPVHWIASRAPHATVAVFPSDHLVLEEETFMAQVADVAAYIDARPERIVLLGVPATEAETEYGWIEPGAVLGRARQTAVRAVRRFVEKPSPDVAQRCLAAGAAWNTFVFVGKARALVEAGRRGVPRLHAELERVIHLTAGGARAEAVRRLHAALPVANFSRDVLEHVAPMLAVAMLTGVTWCDWGSPRRVVRSLERLRITPPWLDRLTEPVGAGPER